MIIYKTTNLINGKIYIGQDFKNNPKYLGSGKLLKLALKKYGVDNFSKETICTCANEKELDEKEIFFIKEFNSTNRDVGYNLCEGGRSFRIMIGENNANFGKKLSEEERKKISYLTKKAMTKEVCEKIKRARKNQTFSEETREKFRANFSGDRNPNFGKKGELCRFYGTKHSEQTKLKISESNRGIKNGMYGKSGNLNPCATRYYIQNKDDILVFDGRKAVMDFLGCSIGFFGVKSYKNNKLIKTEKINI